MKKLMLLSMIGISLSAAATPGDVYIYPAQGQPAEQVEKDRYACYLWASRESGFDPSEVQDLEPGELVQVPVADNPYRGATARGSVIGAIAGVAIGDSHEGAAVGAVLGTIAGAIIEGEGHKQARAEARAEAEAQAQYEDDIAAGYEGYRRAFTACLEGRGYVVR